ncbi:MAG TPA: OmpA family protein [Puia sp.]|nr:OmpA family protein [Puia sp.]
MKPIYNYFVVIPIAFASCVSSGAYKSLQKDKDKSDSLYSWAMGTLKTCQGDNDRLTKQMTAMKDHDKELSIQMTAYRDNNDALHKQLADLSAISSAQAESIKKSIDNIGAKDLYLQQLRTAISRRDSINLSALMEMKAAMGSFSSGDLAIKVEKGVINLDVSDSILFGTDSSGSATVTPKGKTFLLRLARVLNDQTDVSCTVEGHPDSTGQDSAAAAVAAVPDGWGVSVRRAAAVVQLLQDQFSVPASRLIAAGSAGPGSRTKFRIIPKQDDLEDALEKR